MRDLVILLLGCIASLFKSRKGLQIENLALRHQLCVFQRKTRRPNIQPVDRIFWVLLARAWSGWKDALLFVKPETIILWQRKRFREHWRNKSREGKPGRPAVSQEIRELIRTISRMNPLWGSPRIVGELAKLGVHVSKSTVEKYRVRSRKQPSPTWRSFLQNHAKELVSMDFLVVPTVRFKFLYVLIFLSVDRRRIIHFGVTQHPTANWTAQQVIEAFPWDESPKYLLRDRDAIYGFVFQSRVKRMGIKEVLTAPRSPWQNPYSERLNGSLRRECLDHIITFNECHLRRVMKSYVEYYNRYRTHLSLAMDSPEGREPQKPEHQKVVSIPHLGSLHHHYERRAA